MQKASLALVGAASAAALLWTLTRRH